MFSSSSTQKKSLYVIVKMLVSIIAQRTMYDLKEMKYMNIVHKRWLHMFLGNKDLVPHNPGDRVKEILKQVYTFNNNKNSMRW